jgi:hypothetical protein
MVVVIVLWLSACESKQEDNQEIIQDDGQSVSDETSSVNVSGIRPTEPNSSEESEGTETEPHALSEPAVDEAEGFVFREMNVDEAVKAISSGTFGFKYEEEENGSTAIIAIRNGDMYIDAYDPDQNANMQAFVKDRMMYMIDPTTKTMLKMDFTEGNWNTPGNFGNIDFKDAEQVDSGTRTIDEVTYDYISLKNSDNPHTIIILSIDNIVKAIEMGAEESEEDLTSEETEDREESITYVTGLTDSVPESIFNMPEGYTEMSMEEYFAMIMGGAMDSASGNAGGIEYYYDGPLINQLNESDIEKVAALSNGNGGSSGGHAMISGKYSENQQYKTGEGVTIMIDLYTSVSGATDGPSWYTEEVIRELPEIDETARLVKNGQGASSAQVVYANSKIYASARDGMTDDEVVAILAREWPRVKEVLVGAQDPTGRITMEKAQQDWESGREK